MKLRTTAIICLMISAFMFGLFASMKFGLISAEYLICLFAMLTFYFGGYLLGKHEYE